jgi:hypothetical protein
MAKMDFASFFLINEKGLLIINPDFVPIEEES